MVLFNRFISLNPLKPILYKQQSTCPIQFKHVLFPLRIRIVRCYIGFRSKSSFPFVPIRYICISQSCVREINNTRRDVGIQPLTGLRENELAVEGVGSRLEHASDQVVSCARRRTARVLLFACHILFFFLLLSCRFGGVSRT